MQFTYSCADGEDWISQILQIELDRIRACQLVLENGYIFLSEEPRPLFGPDLEKTDQE